MLISVDAYRRALALPEVEVPSGSAWVELLECGLAAAEVLAWAGLPARYDGLAMGMLPSQKNVLLRVVLRHPTRTLTDSEANELRDGVYAAAHQGTVRTWASPSATLSNPSL